jgi:lon-related putative ATP-dependent protease
LDLYVRFIATATKNNGCRPLDRDAVAAVIEHGSRQVDSQKKLTLRFNSIANLLVEAEYYAAQGDSKVITAEHIRIASDERQQRSCLIADKMHEDLLDGQLLLSSQGKRVGVINGLAVLSVGEHEFGRPFRVTARCFAGQAGIVNIEHEVNMSGEIHDKGVQILAGFMGHRFAQKRPLALTATVTFEQSYGSVDGDSASSTWLCAIISALSGVPIDQGLGVTGSVNQLGDMQPIGGVNHKIEGFYRFCEAGGLTGQQGVVIPWQNAQHLMLTAPVRKAMAEGNFHVWPVRTVDEAIERVTGVKAGALDKDGNYHPGTVMHLVQRRIDELREHLEEPADQVAAKRLERATSGRNRRSAKET